MELSREWHLQDIAEWINKDSKIKIPPLQRGLVWKPKQVEMLWDSILRGFPIGSFLLSKSSDDSYDLMDGQQRFNAIASAFLPLGDESQSEIWIDIDPPQVKTTRVFWIKVTTIAHPWGYKNDDECNLLSASERRNALVKFGKNEGFNIYHDNKNNNLTLRDSFPYTAKTPIPLKYMLDAYKETDDASNFAELVLNKIKNSKRTFAKKEYSTDEKTKIEFLYHIFKKLDFYTVHSNIMDIQKVEIDNKNQDDEKQDDATSLEILFNRLNSNGTPITAAELKYSAIKAFWPEIKDINDRLSQGFMPAQKLVLCIFRLVLTKDKRKLQNEPSIAQIRGFAQDDEKKESVNNEYHNCKKYIHTINEWLGIDDTIDSTPTLIRTYIINNSPDLFFLLFFMASQQQNCFLGKIKDIKAFTFFIHLFVDRKLHKQIAEYFIQEFFRTSENKSFEKAFYRQIAYLVYQNASIPAYQLNLRLDENEINSTKNWVNSTFTTISAKQMFGCIQWNREILLFAQRRFLNANFDRFLSTSGKSWENHNVPWDYDHIVPQDWLSSQRGGEIPFCKKWLNTIGNLAATPFEVNRSKSNDGEWKFYQDNSNTLFFDNSFVEEKFEKRNLKKTEYAIKFANFTLHRLQKIYEQLDEVLSPIDFKKIFTLYESGFIENDFIVSRKKLFKDISDHSSEPTSNLFFNGEKDVEINHPLDWCRRWISTGFKINNKYFVAVVPQGFNYELEIGIRKINRDVSEKIDVTKELNDYTAIDNDFWFIYKNIPADSSAREIAEELERLKMALKLRIETNT